jgi:eukaryotic-like serine/threonine-protein kinase
MRSPSTWRAVGRGATTDPRAVDLYLRARHLMRVPELEPALLALDEAVALAPDDPAILAAHAGALSRLSFFGGSVPGDATAYRRRAKASASRALELAPHLGEPWTAIAAVRSIEGDYLGAARASKTAVSLSPGLVRAQEQVASMMLECGRFDDAIARLKAAIALDATNIARGELARGYALLGRWAEVDAVIATLRADSTASKFSRLTMLARMRLWDPSRPEAPDDVGLDPTRGGPVTLFTWWSREVRRGQKPPPDLAAIVQAIPLGTGPRTLAIAGQMTAEVYAASEQYEFVYPLIEVALKGSFIDLGWMDHCPVIAPLRSDPRFVTLREQVAGRAAAVLAALDGPPESI